MKKAALFLCVFLAACAVAPMPPQTITITKTVPVYPPATLYSDGGGCDHGAAIEQGTVRDLANALIDERAAVDVCKGDRAALRKWRADNEAK